MALGPGPGWSKFRADLHNDGVSPIQLDLSSAPGPKWQAQLVKFRGIAASPAVAADGTVYEVDGGGHLVAYKPDGTLLCTSDVVNTA